MPFMPRFFPVEHVLNDPLPIQNIFIRQGDRLTSFAVAIEDEYGNPLDLTGTRCFLTLRPLTGTIADHMFVHKELVINVPTDGIVSYDWQIYDTMTTEPGLYDVLIEVEDVNGGCLTVPSADQHMIVNLRSSIASDHFLIDTTGALVRDQETGEYIPYDPTTIHDGMFELLPDGSYEYLIEVPETGALLQETGFSIWTELGEQILLEDGTIPTIISILAETTEPLLNEDGSLMFTEDAP